MNRIRSSYQPHCLRTITCIFSAVALATALLVRDTPTANSVQQPTVFPVTIDRFSNVGVHHYKNTALGYTVNYQTKDEREVLDVFVFPARESTLELNHEQRATQYLREAQFGIDRAVRDGWYQRAQLVDMAHLRAIDHVVLRAKHLFQRNDSELLSVTYVTERASQIIKIRVSVPTTNPAGGVEAFEETAIKLIAHARQQLPAL